MRLIWYPKTSLVGWVALSLSLKFHIDIPQTSRKHYCLMNPKKPTNVLKVEIIELDLKGKYFCDNIAQVFCFLVPLAMIEDSKSKTSRHV